jgi:hypothetical protein
LLNNVSKLSLAISSELAGGAIFWTKSWSDEDARARLVYSGDRVDNMIKNRVVRGRESSAETERRSEKT